MTSLLSVSKRLYSLGGFFVLFFVVSFGVGSGQAHAALTSEMSVGSTGTNVTELQQFLATDPSIYPQGTVTGYYGALTKAAVTQFQVDYDISQVGNVGPVTLAKLNSLMNSGLGLDTSAPWISNVAVATTSTGATVSWTTNESAQGQVYYSTQAIQSNEATAHYQMPYISGTLVANTTDQTTQSIPITGLAPSTTYYYVIRAVDPSGNVGMSLQRNFTTTN